jgi:hypothetical protein
MAGPSFDPATGLNVPVELPPGLAARLAQPICADISLPKPASVKLNLPFGGQIAAVVDARDAVPDSCALNFSLLMQLGPILAPMKCFLAVLNLVAPLIDIVKGLPFPPAKAIADFAEAVPPVLECIAQITGLGLPLFLKDVICLIISLLNCLIGQLRSILELTNGLSIQIAAAEGNPQLLATLECAQGNAENAADAAMQSFEPVVAILELIAPILDSVTGQSIEIPALAPAEGTEAMEGLIATLEEFSAALGLIADALGGCD